MKLRWTTKTPTDGWRFQRWKSGPKHWSIVEIGWGQIMEAGLTTRTIKDALKHGAQWAGPIKLPESLNDY